MRRVPTLQSERLLYKPLSLQHLSQDYVNWLNDSEVNRFLESGGNYTIELLEKYLREVEEKKILFWAIHKKSDDKHIGNIKIDPVFEKHGRAEYGIMIGDKPSWGKGFANEATKAIIGYCFNELKLRKITLGVILNNSTAYSLYKKLGFETEGIFKQHSFHDNKYCDVVRMALFNRNLDDEE